MEIAAAALSSIGSLFTSGTATAATTTAATTASAASGFTQLFSLPSLLQGGLGLLAASSALRAGESNAAAREAQAADATLEAGMEATRGAERRASLKSQLVKELGDRDAAYGASGIDASFGTPALARDQAVADANRALSVDGETENMRRARLLSRAQQYRVMAEDARVAGQAQALAGVGRIALDATRRG